MSRRGLSRTMRNLTACASVLLASACAVSTQVHHHEDDAGAAVVALTSVPPDVNCIVPESSLRSTEGDGAVIPGLRADYSDGSGMRFTVYGEGPILHGWPSLYEGQTSSLWGGHYDTNWGIFAETLTGEILIE